jgi:hypothetical protein
MIRYTPEDFYGFKWEIPDFNDPPPVPTWSSGQADWEAFYSVESNCAWVIFFQYLLDVGGEKNIAKKLGVSLTGYQTRVHKTFPPQLFRNSALMKKNYVGFIRTTDPLTDLNSSTERITEEVFGSDALVTVTYRMSSGLPPDLKTALMRGIHPDDHLKAYRDYLGFNYAYHDTVKSLGLEIALGEVQATFETGIHRFPDGSEMGTIHFFRPAPKPAEKSSDD